jgi:ABC-type branched-subunit amino acid transport system substrate-binding protein
LAKRANIPVVCQGIEHASYAGLSNVIRFMNTTDEYMDLLYSYIRKRNWRNIAIVMADHPYVDSLLATLRKKLTAHEAITIVDQYPTGQIDMRSTVSKIKKSQFDAIGVFLVPGQIGQFYQQLRRQKVLTPTFGTNYFENADERALGGDQMEKAVYVHNQVNTQFADRYEAEFGDRSQLAFAGMAYEFGSLVGRLFNTNQGIPAESIIGALRAAGTQPATATQSYSFVSIPSKDQYFRFPIALKEITDTGIKVIAQADN